MARSDGPLADNPKHALAAFLEEIHDLYYVWYEKSVNRHNRIWQPLYWSGLLISAATAAVAAFASEESFRSFGVVRILLILLPILGVFVSTIAVQSRLLQRYQLRENGRRKVQALWNEGRRRFAAASSPEEYSAIHEELEAKLDRIEEDQGASFFAFVTAVDSSPEKK